MRQLRHLARHECGATAIEFALISMILISVSIGTIEVGRALMLYNALAHGADRAARLLMIHPTDTNEKLRERWLAERARFSIGIPESLFPEFGSVTGVYRPVTLSYKFKPMLKGSAFTSDGITISATRRVPVS